MEEIKKRLKIAMDNINMSSKELSDKTGIPKSSISQYLSGYAKPKQDRIYLISKVLGINEAWLIGYNVPMKADKFRDLPTESHKSFTNIEDFQKMYGKSNLRSDRLINAIIENAEKMKNDSKKDLLDYSFYLLEKENPNSILHAAHDRTDIEVTDEMKKHDDDIMNNDSEWE